MTRRVAALAAALALLLHAAAVGAGDDPRSRVLSVDARTGAATTLAEARPDEIAFWTPLGVRPDGSVVLRLFRDELRPLYGEFLEERAPDGALLASRRRAMVQADEQPSPDLARVLFLERAGGRDAVAVADLVGRHRRRLAGTTGRGQDIAAGWSRDGRIVVARSFGTLGEHTEFLVLAASGRPQRRFRCSSGYVQPGRLAVAPDGRHSAVVLDLVLTLVDHADGTCRPLGDLSGYEVAWSPDGRTIAFDTIGSGFALIDLATGRVQRVRMRAIADALVWSPDGRRIATISEEDGSTQSRRSSLHVYDIARRRWRTLASGVSERLSPPMWTPDGESLVVSVFPQ